MAYPQWNYGVENPSILHDARRSRLDGSYIFQYETQDGIRHDSRATPEKLVSGIYSYTDPTGLKVSWSYNAGAPAQGKSSASSSSAAKPVTSARDYYDYGDEGSYYPSKNVPSKPSSRASAPRASLDNFPGNSRRTSSYSQPAQAPSDDYYDYYDSGYESTRS